MLRRIFGPVQIVMTETGHLFRIGFDPWGLVAFEYSYAITLTLV
jgi:hypothetical protein